nr:hypothetical protein [Actinomycetota bacterium]
MTVRYPLALRLAPVPALALLAVVVVQAAAAPTAIDAFERSVGILVAAGVAVAAVVARPAWTLSAALVLSIFSSHWDELGAPVDLDRVVVLLGLSSLLYREWRHRDGRLQTRPVDWALAVLVLYVVVSGLLSGELSRDRGDRFELIDSFGLVPFAFFFAAPFAFRTERDRRVLLGALVGLGFYLGTVAILETTGPEELIVPSYITDDSIGGHHDRARGPTLDAGANGIAMFGCGVAAAIAFMRWRSRWRWFALLVAGLCALGVLLALTRAGWI